MARMNHRSFSSATPLTDDQMFRNAPSIFATEAHRSRSDRFSTIPTIDIIRGMAKEGFLPYSVGQCISRDESRQDFTKHMVRFRKEGLATIRGSIFEIVMVNGNDGSAAYRLDAGVFRIACLNGMIVKSEDFGSLKVRHTGDALGKVIEGSYTVLGQAEKTLDTAGRWTGIQLAKEERLAFANGALVERFGEDESQPGRSVSAITPEQFLIPRRYEDGGNDLWTTMNVIQENAVRGGIASRNNGRRNTSREITGIDQNVSVNKAIWSMAEWLEGHKRREARVAA